MAVIEHHKGGMGETCVFLSVLKGFETLDREI